MNATEYLRPTSIEEALEALKAHAPDAVVIAGGTDLVPMMRRARYAQPDNGDGDASGRRLLVDVGRLAEIQGVGETDGVVRIGGATSVAAIASSPVVVEKLPVLAAAALSIGSPLVRNRATIGGNLATASPSADTAPALLALDAVARLRSLDGGVRDVPIADFFIGYRSTQLGPTELISDIFIPVPSPRSGGRFEKVGLRNADAISVVCVAAVVELEGATCTKARIALGAVAPTPVRAWAVESALRGREVDGRVARECARLVHEDISPIDDVRGSGAYRSLVAEAVVARTIMRIVGTEDAE